MQEIASLSFLEILVFLGQIKYTFDLRKAGSYNTFCLINVFLKVIKKTWFTW